MKIRASIALLALVLAALSQQASEPRVRARDLGIRPGVLPTGKLNATTDVAGVKVGHVTLRIGDSVRTGVTAILPHDGNIFQRKMAEAVWAEQWQASLKSFESVLEPMPNRRGVQGQQQAP